MTGAGGGTVAEPTTAHAAVLMAPGRIELLDMDHPEPRVGEVVVRLSGCGVCASNLEPWAGQPWLDYPFEAGSPGHEGWGSVESVGAGVAGLEPGDRVATVGDRSFATHERVAADRVVRLPPELEDAPFPGEPLGCAINIFDRSGIRRGDRVAMVGVGFLGALVTQLAVAAGARVVGVSRRPFSLAVSRSAGSERTIALEDGADRAVSAVEEWTDGELCDVVVEATGKQEPLDLAARLTRVRGRLVIAGYHQEGPRQVDMQLWNWRGLDVINAHERDPARYVAGIRAAVRATLEGRMDPAPLITHDFPLADLGAALDYARDRPAGFLKAVVRP